MSDFHQHDDDAVPLVFIAFDEYAQSRKCLDAEGARAANGEAVHALREFFALARSHRMRITAAIGAPARRRGRGRRAVSEST